MEWWSGGKRCKRSIKRNSGGFCPEGTAGLIEAQGFNLGNPSRRRNRPERAADLLSTVQFTKEPQNLGLVAIFAEPGIPG
jgi:hypothetical protein